MGVFTDYLNGNLGGFYHVPVIASNRHETNLRSALPFTPALPQAHRRHEERQVRTSGTESHTAWTFPTRIHTALQRNHKPPPRSWNVPEQSRSTTNKASYRFPSYFIPFPLAQARRGGCLGCHMSPFFYRGAAGTKDFFCWFSCFF